MNQLRVFSLLFICVLGLPKALLAQDRSGTFQFVNVAPDAITMALGGANTSSIERSPAIFLNNPAFGLDTLNNNLELNYLRFNKAYDLFSVYYQKNYRNKGVISAGLRHLTTGDIAGYDIAGNTTGTFSSAQTALTVGYALGRGNFRYGMNLTFLNSAIATYHANAMALSAGGIFIHPKKDFTLGMSIQNVGFVMNSFSETESEKLPWDIHIGTTFKPEHMPFRFSFTVHHPFNDNLLNDEISSSTFREVMSHVIIGTEVILSRSISMFAGYNHLVRQELKLQQTSGGAGFSYGLRWSTRTFYLAYGRGAYHLAGAANMLSLNINLNRFL